MSTETLAGEFVTLRPLREADAELTLGWRLSDRAALLNPGARTVEEQAGWIRARPAGEFNFMIELTAGRPVGMLSLVNVDRHNLHAESARFLIGDEEGVKGVPAAVEAMKLLYEFAFGPLGLERVWGMVASETRGMIKWQRSLGMVEEGRLRRHYHLHGDFQDGVVLGILADEFATTARPRMEALIAAGRRHHEAGR